jgi:hypothetical protein
MVRELEGAKEQCVGKISSQQGREIYRMRCRLEGYSEVLLGE